MKNRRLFLLPLGCAVLVLTGCTFPTSGKTLSQSQVGQLQKIAVGTVTKVSPVTIDGSKSMLGQYGGAVIGAAAVVPSGGISNSGQALATAGASIVGAITGQAVEEYVTRKKAQQITVEMPNGEVYVIVQPSPPDFQAGDKVHVISGPYGARVELALDF